MKSNVTTSLAITTATLLASTLPAQLPRPPAAKDHNPSPTVFETVLTATAKDIEFVPGHKTKAMAFNGSVPGPTIRAKVGDTLIVHFVNMLPEPTVIHWHGVATPATMDGSQIAQTAVPRSGYRRYEFKLNVAGTFWYHPHTNTNEQVERGLYGALIVQDQDDAKLAIPPEQDRVLFLDDIKLGDDHQLTPFASDMAEDFVPFERAEDLANSRVGNHVLVNGQAKTPKLTGRPGTAYRLRLINASSGRIFRLDLSQPKPGLGNAQLHIIGSDQGLWNQAEPVLPINQIVNTVGHHNEMISNPDRRLGVTLTPGDRLDLVVVMPRHPVKGLHLRSHDFIKGKHTAYVDPEGNLLFGHDHFDGAKKPQPLLHLAVAGSVHDAGWSAPSKLRRQPIEPLDLDPKLPALPVFFGHSPPDKDTGNVMFFLQVDKPAALWQRILARQPALPIDYGPRPMMKVRAGDGYAVRVGQTRVFHIVNFTGNDHNFHLHGFRFQHLDTEFIDLDEKANNRKHKPLRLSNEDTLRIPRRPGLVLARSYTVVRLACRFDDSDLPQHLQRSTRQLQASGLTPGANSSGGWLLHCHFLEHGAKGMMSFVSVR